MQFQQSEVRIYILRFLVLISLVTLCTSYKGFKTKAKGQQKTITIIEYNVWDGFESEERRTDAFVKWARDQNADIIAFEELNNFTQASFSKLAKTWGHPYAVISKESGYPVGISSRYPINNVYKLIAGMHHGCLYAEINGINFFVVHFSPFSSAKRLHEADTVIYTLSKKNDLAEKTIVLGDFNSFSSHDSLFYAGSGVRDSMYKAQQSNKVLQNLNGKNEIDYGVVNAFLQAGFFDSYALFYKNFNESYPSKVYPSVPLSEKIRIDYIMLSKKLKASCRSVEIIKDPVTDTLSDHYPVKAVFDVQ